MKVATTKESVKNKEDWIDVSNNNPVDNINANTKFLTLEAKLEEQIKMLESLNEEMKARLSNIMDLKIVIETQCLQHKKLQEEKEKEIKECCHCHANDSQLCVLCKDMIIRSANGTVNVNSNSSAFLSWFAMMQMRQRNSNIRKGNPSKFIPDVTPTNCLPLPSSSSSSS